MPTLIDLSNWHRKEYFEFFSNFDNPFLGVAEHIYCTQAYRYAKEQGISFFAWYLHQACKLANSMEIFRYRYVDGQVWLYEVVHAATTLPRPDGSFAFSCEEYDPDFDTFLASLNTERTLVQNTTGLLANPHTQRPDVIHFTAVPWSRFTSLSHARNYGTQDSIPKIAFGKIYQEGKDWKMPVSVEAHHGMMDGRHVGLYLNELEAALMKAT